MSQFDMFPPQPRPPARITPEDVRPELTEVLDRLRGAEVMPLSTKDLRFWRTVFPQMSRWLPEEEREAICAEFGRQLSRLEARAAA